MKNIFTLGIGFTCLLSSALAFGFPKSYYKITNAKEQKREFINILKPLVDKGNAKVLAQREFVLSFFIFAKKSAFRNIPSRDIVHLARLAKKYKIKALFDELAYKKRVDIVPVSLALTQGAIESGWGKSRFVREANNLFGHWTWGEVGLVPSQRDEGKTHKIRIFQSLQASVDAYILNLNRNYAYRLFRQKRYEVHAKGEAFTGYEAAKTMLYYSQLREEYVKMLQKMMQDNHLLYFDEGIKSNIPAGL